MSIHAHHPADTASVSPTRHDHGPSWRSPWSRRSSSSSTSPWSTRRCRRSPSPSGLGENDLQAIVTAYLMCSGGGLLLGGRIADLLSRRTVFLVGLALFTSRRWPAASPPTQRSSSPPAPCRGSAPRSSPRPRCR